MNSTELKTGTTTIGIIAKEALVFAADMQATMGYLSYDQESKKIYKLTDRTAVTTAGSVGDSLILVRFLQAQARLYEVERETQMTVKSMVSYLSNVLNANRFFPYEVQLIIGGWVRKPELFEMVPDGGVIERTKYATSGSGTTMAMTVLDQNYKPDLSTEEAMRLAVRAISASKKRDIYSGGRSITLLVVDGKGAREIDAAAVTKIIEEEKGKNSNAN